jgi:hypothetical protein
MTSSNVSFAQLDNLLHIGTSREAIGGRDCLYCGFKFPLGSSLAECLCHTEADHPGSLEVLAESLLVKLGESHPVARAKGVCHACSSKGNLLRCSRCRNVYYCSRDCQVANWKAHKTICTVSGSFSEGMDYGLVKAFSKVCHLSVPGPSRVMCVICSGSFEKTRSFIEHLLADHPTEPSLRRFYDLDTDLVESFRTIRH